MLASVFALISVRVVENFLVLVPALRGVSFVVTGGQVVGLLGANGAGKTTTIRMITGFLPPDAGSVAVAGHDTIEEALRARACLGYLTESAPAYGEMGVGDYLRFRARLHRIPSRRRGAAIDRVVGVCELAEVRRRRIGHLSKGFRQRVGLAAALLHDPPVVVLDEPTNALDPRQIGQTRRLIRELASDKAVLVSSHVLPEVEKTCDRVVIMARGIVRVDARPGELLEALREAAPYLVEVRAGEAARGAAALTGLRGVERVEAEPAGGEAWERIRVAARADAPELGEAIAAGLGAAGVPFRELRREAPGLERIFLDLLETDERPRRPGPKPEASPA